MQADAEASFTNMTRFISYLNGDGQRASQPQSKIDLNTSLADQTPIEFLGIKK